MPTVLQYDIKNTKYCTTIKYSTRGRTSYVLFLHCQINQYPRRHYFLNFRAVELVANVLKDIVSIYWSFIAARENKNNLATLLTRDQSVEPARSKH